MIRSPRYLTTKRVLQLVTLGLVVGAAGYSCAAQLFAWAESDSSGNSVVMTRTLLESQGPGYLLVFMVLAALTACPLLLRGTSSAIASVEMAAVLTTFTVLGAMTIGGLFLPAAVASCIAALLPMRGRGHTPMVSEAT